MNREERAATAKAAAVGVNEITGLVQSVHEATTDKVRKGLSVIGPIGTAPVDAVRVHSTITFAAIRGVANLLGSATAAGVRVATSDDAPSITDSPRGAAIIAGLGSAFGDNLAGNDDTAALAPQMSIRLQGQVVQVDADALAGAFPNATSAIAVLVHGLAVTELGWSADYDAILAECGFSVIHVRYNTGDPVESNAERLAALVDDIDQAWPVPIDRVILVGHSMGGLISRGAARIADDAGARWISVTTDVVTLGTPHGGAPLEKGASAAIGLLRFAASTRPFADLADRRSQGIKDLRWGNVESVPDHIRHHAVVAHLGDHAGTAKSVILGDGMVRTHSAAGSHGTDVDRRVVPIGGAGHLNLLDHEDVAALLAEVADSKAAVAESK